VRIRAVLAVLAVSGMVSGSALAVSDGNYDYRKNGCSSHAHNSDKPKYTETHCHFTTVIVYDGSGHQYFGIGLLQTPDGTTAHGGEYWFDAGTGTRYIQPFDVKGPGTMQAQKSKSTAHPETGLHVYFGMDDNIDQGEHDSSEQVDNGPSDGGGMQANVDPATAQTWLAALMAQNASYVLTHPLPIADAGVGFCADGICLSAQTQRRVAYQGTKRKAHRDVSNYDGKTWDPDSCSGPDDKPKNCGGHPLSWWEAREGTTYVEPGVQFFEDPDAQGSPIGPYPLPAIYVGTCGIIIGGGMAPAFPPSPFTNHAGQLVIRTACT
jgi:hypothetical protein